MSARAHRGVPEETATIRRRFVRNPLATWASASLRARQHGVVTLAQLQLAGLTPSAVRDRVAGRAPPPHPPRRLRRRPPSPDRARPLDGRRARLRRAARSLSHRSAAALHGPAGRQPAPSRTSRLPLQSARSRPRHRRPRDAHAARRRRHHPRRHPAAPRVARTLLDLADVVPRRQLERAVEQAEVLRVFDLGALSTTCSPSANGRRGAARAARACWPSSTTSRA